MKQDSLKDELLANISHELRTPLNAGINILDGISRGNEGPVLGKGTGVILKIPIRSKGIS